MKFPKVLHAKWVNDDTDDPFLNTSDTLDDLGLQLGDAETVAVYRLDRTFKATVVVNVSDIKARKP